jgi:tRNA nucleotidyltransferase/poly(A) polymerase
MRFKRYLIEAKQMLKQWQKYVRDNKELSAAVNVLNKINKAGFKAFIVGGSVRDIVLGNLKPHDVDIATNAPMDVLGRMFKTFDIGKSRDFGIVVVRQGPFAFEIAQFRQDGKYKDGRRPESVKISGSFEQDAARRDFTINAMAINARGEIVDYFDGRKDIQNKILRTVGDPRQRFGEDFLRMLRAPRFASKFGLEIEKGTEKAIQKLSTNIKELAPERIHDELIKAASQSGDKFANFIIQLDKLKLLKFILPEVLNLKWFRENLRHHPETVGSGGTVYAHVLAALRKSDTADPIKNLAILLHDVGKGVTFSQKEGLPRYLEHAKMSVNLVRDIANRLKMSNKDKDALLFAVGNHMKFHTILNMRPSKIAKLVSDDNWDVLLAVARADEFARGETFMHKGEFEKIVDKAIKIKEKFGMPVVNNTLKLVDGKHVMNLTGLKPGKKIGEIIRKTTEWIIDNGITDQGKIDDHILKLGSK